jgi:hypothetical protein
MAGIDRFSEQEFDSLESMMGAFAGEAVRQAAASHGMMLDFSPESVGRLETVLAAEGPVSGSDLEWATKLWGSYFGEVFRHNHPVDWVMSVYPGSTMSMPALESHGAKGSQLYPLLKVQRRLTMGPAEDLSHFYAKVSAALKARSKPN